MPTFYKPTTPVAGYDPQTVFSSAGEALSPEAYASQGGLPDFSNVKPVSTINDIPRTGYSPLPSVTAAPPTVTPQIKTPVQSNNPVQNFNLALLDMLTKAQQGVDTTPLYAQKSKLERLQVDNSMKPASELGTEGLTPGAALSARYNASNLYNPEIGALNDRIQLSRQSIQDFSNALNAAKQYSEEYAKSLAPDEGTIQSVQDMLMLGIDPPQDILDKTFKYIDWKAVGQAQQQPTEQTALLKEYNFAVGQGYKGNLLEYMQDKNGGANADTQIITAGGRQLLINKQTGETVKDLGSAPSSGTTLSVSERNLARQLTISQEARRVLDSERSSSGDTKANPDTYRRYLGDYIDAGGTPADFYAKFDPEVYLTKENRTGNLSPKETSADFRLQALQTLANLPAVGVKKEGD